MSAKKRETNIPSKSARPKKGLEGPRRAMGFWAEEPDINEFSEFVFLSVDVIQHSRLLSEHPTRPRLLMVNAALTGLETHVRACIRHFEPRLCWVWAGDGGIFAFPVGPADSPTTKRVVDCAIKILSGLDRFNKESPLPERLRLRIGLDQGRCLFRESAGQRRGNALNIAGKMKVAGSEDSISVTKTIRDELEGQDLQSEFEDLHYSVLEKPVYGYSPAISRGLEATARKYQEENRPAFASNSLFRLGRHLLRKDPKSASEVLGEAIEIAGRDDARTLRFSHVWLRLIGGWTAITVSLPDVCRRVGSRPVDLLRDPEVDALVEKNCGRGAAAFMLHCEFVLAQLDILARTYVEAPTGLSSLQVARLLLRMGMPPDFGDGALGRRLDRVRWDMKDTEHGTIDGDCSICTGTAVSCLALASRKEDAVRAVVWLRGLGREGFRHLGVDYSEADQFQHGGQYAACVFEGLCDFSGGVSDEDWELFATELLRKEKKSKDGYFESWSRWRNITEWDLCTYIMRSLLRLILASRGDGWRKDCAAMETMLRNLLRRIREEEETTDNGKLGNLYALRENLAGFALGRLLGMDDCVMRATQAARLMEKRWEGLSGRGQVRKDLVDSNVDRTRCFLEGWLYDWEVRLRMEARQT